MEEKLGEATEAILMMELAFDSRVSLALEELKTVDQAASSLFHSSSMN